MLLRGGSSKTVVAVNNTTDKIFKFKKGKYHLKEKAVWKSKTAFIEDTSEVIISESAHLEASVYAKCYYDIKLKRSEMEDRYVLSYDDAVRYWKNYCDARVYQIA